MEQGGQTSGKRTIRGMKSKRMKLFGIITILMLILCACHGESEGSSLNKDAQVPEDLDTLELMYIAFACDCQKWVIKEDYEAYYKGERGEGVFDLDKYGYYVESGIDTLGNLPFGKKVRFYGKLRSDFDWPKNADFIDDNPPKGKVFTYYKFEMIE